jgi:hypothetical protein
VGPDGRRLSQRIQQMLFADQVEEQHEEVSAHA